MELKIGDLVRIKDNAIFADDLEVGDLGKVDAFEGEDLVVISFLKKGKVRCGLWRNNPVWFDRFLEKGRDFL